MAVGVEAKFSLFQFFSEHCFELEMKLQFNFGEDLGNRQKVMALWKVVIIRDFFQISFKLKF